MRAVVQRAKSSNVSVGETIVGRIEKGMVVLLGVEDGDTDKDAVLMAKKIANLRIYPDSDGKLNHSILDVSGEVLLISQFTLLGDARKGNRPSFIRAARPDLASTLYQRVQSVLESYGVKTATGQFQCDMLVSIQNDGPVTILLDTKKTF